MADSKPFSLAQVVGQSQADFLADWITEQATHRGSSQTEASVRDQSKEFLQQFGAAAGQSTELSAAARNPVRDMLAGVSRSRTQSGDSPSSVAGFVLSLKKPLFVRIRKSVTDLNSYVVAVETATDLIDGLALYTTEIFRKSREELISRQQQEMMELSTPVVKLWNGILALPMIGTLDSERTQVATESLLNRIVETGAEMAILDITGVPTVDTLTAQHLLKTVAAARLMGADCIISGIRPQIAQTIVHLGVDLQGVTTKTSLADAFAVALKRQGLRVTKVTDGF